MSRIFKFRRLLHGAALNKRKGTKTIRKWQLIMYEKCLPWDEWRCGSEEKLSSQMENIILHCFIILLKFLLCFIIPETSRSWEWKQKEANSKRKHFFAFICPGLVSVKRTDPRCRKIAFSTLFFLAFILNAIIAYKQLLVVKSFNTP